MGLTGDAGKALRGEDDEWIREGLGEHGGHVRMHAGRAGLWGRGTVWAAGVSQADSNARVRTGRMKEIDAPLRCHLRADVHEPQP